MTDFDAPQAILDLRFSYRAGLPREDKSWSARGSVDDDGVLRLYPLFVRDLDRFVADNWFYRMDGGIDASFDPDEYDRGDAGTPIT
jgi:hypothetical protein